VESVPVIAKTVPTQPVRRRRGCASRAAWMPRLRHACRGFLRGVGLLGRGARRTDPPFRLATGDERIYHVHLRKTGGTSLNHVFLGVGNEDPEAAYRELAAHPSRCREWNGYRYVGWNVGMILDGDYFYAFSHAPCWQLDLPVRTFTITCLRDPVERVLSHYWMLRKYAEDAIDHPCMAVEGRWLGRSFDDFIDRIPVEHLKAQLWAFSASCDVDEALDRVRRISHVMFTEEFADGLRRLETRLGMSLPCQHRRAGRRGEVSPESLLRLRDMLADEYELLAGVRAARRSTAGPATA
jgi:hypothetical protein